MLTPKSANETPKSHLIWQVFLIFLRLGFTSFGGPIAHLSYFRNEFVIRRHWLSEHSYLDLVALCQFLPGPASSQVGMAIGLSKAGYLGALAAWLGFTLPSAIAMMLFAMELSISSQTIPIGVLHGLKILAVAVVAQAVWGMGRTLLTNTTRISIAAIAACTVLLWPNTIGQIGVIVVSGLIGLLLFKPVQQPIFEPISVNISRSTSIVCLCLFFSLLLGLPLLVLSWPNQWLACFDVFYRAGALVFGGGHVVLPLLQAELVPNGWVNKESFLAGYGMAQAVPGPLFTFAAFLGATIKPLANLWLSGLLCLFAIFVPSFLLVIGTLPFWQQLRRHQRTQAVLAGINAGVVGLLLAAFYFPVWSSAIQQPKDFALAVLALTALTFWRLPAWLVVMGCGGASWLLN